MFTKILTLMGAIILPQMSWAACDLTLNPGENISSAVAAAAPGSTVCLNSGTHNALSLNGIVKNPRVTIQSTTGQGAVLRFTFQGGTQGINLNSLTLNESFIYNTTRNITVSNSAFKARMVIDGVANANILFDRNTHNAIAAGGWTVKPARIHLPYGSSQHSGVTIQNSVLDGGSADGVQSGAAVNIINNQFKNIREGSCADCHTDAIQFYGGPFTDSIIRGNYFYNNSTHITSFGPSVQGVFIEDNVIDSGPAGRPWCIEWFSDSGSVIRHNTCVYRASCAWGLPCGTINLDRKPDEPAGQGTIVINNIATSITASNGSAWAQRHHNLVRSGAVSGDLTGSPTYSGGAAPSSWSGYQLASNSLGVAAASDGLNMGARTFGVSTPPPPPPPADTTAPTAPANLVATAVSSSQINVSYSASTDLVGVKEYYVERCAGTTCSNFAQVYSGGNLSYSNTNLTPSTTYRFRVRASDAAGNLSPYSSVVSAPTQAVQTPPATGWQNFAFDSQSANFTAQFDAVPSASTQNAVVGLSRAAAGKYDDLAAIVRFGQNGRIDARNGANYAAQASISNVAGRSYRVRMVINMQARTYSVYVTPQGQAEVLLAQNFAFRTTQSSVASLANRAQFAEAGSVAVSNFSLSTTAPPPPPPTDTQAPSVPANIAASAISASQINVSWSASSDNVGVTAYLVESCQGASCTNFTQVKSQPELSYASTGLAASTAYRFRVRARDAAGNISGYSSVAGATTAAASPPPSGVWPNASNTGVPSTVTLTNYTGPMTITVNGTVIDGKSITGMLRINAANVVIKNSRIVTNDYYAIYGEDATNLTVQDCDILGSGNSVGGSAIHSSGTFLRNDISRSENGIALLSGSSTVKGNYIHDLQAAGADAHYDGIAVQGGQSNVLIEDNYIDARDTSDIIIQTAFGPVSNVTINHNYLTGSVGFNVYADARLGTRSMTGIRITNNVMKKGGYGYITVDNTTPVIEGNVDAVTGLPVR